MSCGVRESERLPLTAGENQTSSAKKRSSQRCLNWHPSYTVLAATFLERVAFVSLLAVFTEYHEFIAGGNPTTSKVLLLLCTKVSYVGAVFSGLLADTVLGHYRVLLISILMQFAGSLLVLAAIIHNTMQSAREEVNVVQDSLFDRLVTPGLVLFGLGVAGAGGTEVPLGVSQHSLLGEAEQKAKAFFPRYYFLIGAGVVIGAGIGIVTAQGAAYQIYGHVLPSVFYFFSFLVLALSRGVRTEKPSRAHPLSDVWRVAKEAMKVIWRRPASRGGGGRRSMAASSSVAPYTGRVYWKNSKGSLADWVRYAEESHGGSIQYNTVARVHNFLSAVAVLAAMVIVGVTINQNLAVFISQGNRMTVPRMSASLYVPASAVALFDTLGVLLGIPLVTYVIYPCWRSFSGGTPPSHLQRITVGILIAMLGTVAATILEVERRKEGRWNSTVIEDPDNPNRTLTISSVSIFWQIPQYTLCGLSEVFVLLSGMEFAYSRSPTGMKGISIGFGYAFLGLSAAGSVVLLWIMQQRFESLTYLDDAQGEVHLYFIVLGGILAVGLAVFQAVAMHFKTAPIYGLETMSQSHPATYSTSTAMHSSV
ncbi:solute carrier family 15 member 4-like [Sycon ciliatum]|uniref:solute carrier family 15 member 4-like n=1 Tax=Sycon ciliatum TaxID=27933 RepID=UPI0031F71083